MDCKKAPSLTKQQKENRVQWCLDNQNTDWTKVIFTDEAYFQAFRNKLMMWGKTRPQVSEPKWKPKVLVWGGIGWRGSTCLKVAEGTVNSEVYQEILSECLIETANIHYPDGYILQQDNATAHTSKSTREFFKTHNIKVLKWPANSPDLNPIENLWSIMKNRVEKMEPEKTSDIVKAVNIIWNEVSQEVRESLIQ